MSTIEDVEVIAAWTFAEEVLPRLREQAPDLLLIAEERPFGEQVASLTSQIMEACPELPVIRVALDQTFLRIFTAHTLPARSAELIELIRGLPGSEGGPERGPHP